MRPNLTCPCNNICPNTGTVTPHNLPKSSFKGLFIGPGAKDAPGLRPVSDLGSAPEGPAGKEPTYGDLPWTMQGVDKAGHEGPTGHRCWQGVHAIVMVTVSTLVCLLSEVRLSPPKLTKADIVGVCILARWPVHLQKDPECVEELFFVCGLVFNFESLVSHIWPGFRCRIHYTSVVPQLSWLNVATERSERSSRTRK